MQALRPFPERLTRIALTGFMGAGKSTVGPLLARRLGWRFLDADRVIEQRTGSSIAGIFSSQGEPAFRRLEAETIAGLLTESGLVLALGGGALEAEATRALLAGDAETFTIFLDAPLTTLLARCDGHPGAARSAAPAVRPLLQNRHTLEERHERRLPHYREAHLTIDTSSLRPSEVAARIVEALEKAVEATAAGKPSR